MPQAYNVWAHASDEHIDRYLRPALRGELKDAYAVTERDAGSDPSQIAATAERTDAGFRINGEKWFVTGGDHAAVYVVMANVRRRRRAAADPVRRRRRARRDRDRRRPGLHPQLSRRPPDDPLHRRRGRRGRRDRRRRRRRRAAALLVHRGAARDRRPLRAARCGACSTRPSPGRPRASRAAPAIFDHQGVSFPLADSAADAAAGRLLTFTVAELADAGADPKLVHNKASMAKLFTSEAACRCADRCVQAFGGRGYMRSNVAERLLRELRVDRIWEGTSEIQRLIVARGLERRGVERMLH